MSAISKADLDKISALIDGKITNLQLLLEGEFALTQLSQFNPPKNSIPRTSVYRLQDILDSKIGDGIIQDKISERDINGTVFTNLTGKSIIVSIACEMLIVHKGDLAELVVMVDSIDGATLENSFIGIESQDTTTDIKILQRSTLTFVVPSNYKYSAQSEIAGSGTVTLNHWNEF